MLLSISLAAHSTDRTSLAASASMTISELHYHPGEGQSEASEFLEFLNTGARAIDVSGWRMDDGIRFEWPKGSRLGPGERMLIVGDEDAFHRDHKVPAETTVAVFSGKLDNGGERLRLVDEAGQVVFAMAYDDALPWPVAPDGAGVALERYDFDLDPASPLAWRAGGPSPGRLNSVAGEAPGVRVLSAGWTPLRPREGEMPLVEVEVRSPAPIARATLFLTIGFGEQTSPGERRMELPLNDAGRDGDEHAGDGRWATRLPGLPESTLLRFYARFEDSIGGSARWPGAGAATALEGFQVGRTPPEGTLPVYDLWIEPGDLAALEGGRGDRRFPAILVHEGRVFDDVFIRQRGAFARSWPKKSFKIFLNRDRKIEGRRRINLNSGWRDPAFLREHLAYRLYAMAGAPHSRSRIVELWVNGEPYGAYLDVEQPDEDYLRRFELDGASLYKADSARNQSDERAFPRASDYAVHYELETESDSPHADLHAFCSGLDRAQRRGEGRAFLEAELDIERFEAFLVATAFTSNWDSYNKNHFVAGRAGDAGRWTLIPWDLDRTLGDHWAGSFRFYRLSPLLGTRAEPGVTGWNRVIEAFLADPRFRAGYEQRLARFVQAYDHAAFRAWIDDELTLAEGAIDLDRSRWNGDISGRGWRAGVTEVERYLANRRDFLLKALPPVLPSPSPGPLDGMRSYLPVLSRP